MFFFHIFCYFDICLTHMFTFCLLFQRHSCFSNVTVCQAFKLKERDREKEKERERV